MPKVHEAIGFVVVAVFTVGWLWGGGALVLKRDPGERFWTWITVEQILAKLREAEVALSQGQLWLTSALRSVSPNKPTG